MKLGCHFFIVEGCYTYSKLLRQLNNSHPCIGLIGILFYLGNCISLVNIPPLRGKSNWSSSMRIIPATRQSRFLLIKDQCWPGWRIAHSRMWRQPCGPSNKSDGTLHCRWVSGPSCGRSGVSETEMMMFISVSSVHGSTHKPRKNPPVERRRCPFQVYTYHRYFVLGWVSRRTDHTEK